ncbi:phosphotransferase [Timonella sp. A28]|uniref:phosphotransferase n=1 Tax=Timonella sp. A28 TaxID=3442640 RepID=UPI003EBB6A4F
MSAHTTQWSEAEQVEFFSSTEIIELIEGMYQSTGVAKRASLVELHHRPGAGVSGLFEVLPSDPPSQPPAGTAAAAAQPLTTAVYLVATSESLPEDTGSIVRMSSERGDLALWEHPFDPGLVGLPAASIPENVQRIWGQGADLIDLETIAYRPLRRAVLKAQFAEPVGQIFLKVLRKDAQLLWRKHRLLQDAGAPVPQLIGEPIDEVVALTTVSGVPLAQAIMNSRVRPITGAQIIAVLNAFPQELATMPGRPAWTDRLGWYAHAAKTAIPDQSVRIDTLVAHIEAVLHNAERGPLVPNHGDFYEANLFVRNGEISGLIDIDSAGPGYLIDDLACFIGHLAVLPTLDPRYAHVPAYVDEYLADFAYYLQSQGITVAGLYARTASVILTLVAGARDEENPMWEDYAEQRLALAESMLSRVGVLGPT